MRIRFAPTPRMLILAAASAMGAAAATAQRPAPIDVAAQLIGNAKASFARVRDYAGLFYKQEHVGGQLQPEQTIQIRVRQQPFSVHMKWVGPKKLAGQEACYVAGRNNNMMRAKSNGAFLSAIGFVSLDPRDPKAMNGHRHAITESGIGHLIEQLEQNHQTDRQQPADHTAITFGEYRFLNRPVIRMEALHRQNTGRFYSHRCVVYFDKETHLPVRIEAYDWPRAGGPPGGELLECYSYADVKFNVNLTDAAFNY